MHFATLVGFSAIVLLILLLLSLEFGRRLGQARARDTKGTEVLEAAVFSLVGLLIAFTFYGAAARFEERRRLITTEVNAIGTAYLRLEVIPAPLQPELRRLFGRYVDIRLTTYRVASSLAAATAMHSAVTDLQKTIWAKGVQACRDPKSPPFAGILLLPALNSMFDIATTQFLILQLHPPLVVFALLVGLSLIGSLLAGYGMAGSLQRNWLFMLAYAVTLTLAVYVIVELEYPRVGLIRVNAADHALVDLRKSMP